VVIQGEYDIEKDIQFPVSFFHEYEINGRANNCDQEQFKYF